MKWAKLKLVASNFPSIWKTIRIYRLAIPGLNIPCDFEPVALIRQDGFYESFVPKGTRPFADISTGASEFEIVNHQQ